MPSDTASGKPYFVAATSGPPKNNGATVLMGGNATISYPYFQATPVSQVLGSAYLGYRSGNNGAIVPLTPNGFGVVKALSGGNFAQMTAGKYIGMRYQNMQIAGSDSTLLRGGAALFPTCYRAENRYVGYVRNNAVIMTGGWIYQTGKPVFRRDETDSIPNDAAPTRLIPGKLTYMFTGTTAKVDSYKAKND